MKASVFFNTKSINFVQENLYFHCKHSIYEKGKERIEVTLLICYKNLLAFQQEWLFEKQAR